jgi:ABC-type transport system substrate-binding protein
VLVRNPRYSGARPHHFARMIVTFRVKRKTADAQIEAGTLDYALDGVDPGDVARLEKRFGAHSPAASRGRRQLFVTVEPALDYLALNTTRGTFTDARVRRAASLAVDRSALAAGGSPFGGSREVPTAAYLPPGMPGYVAAGAASLRADLKEARRLAGRTRRNAVFYTCTSTGCARIGQLVKTELARIGISVEVRTFSIGELFTREVRPGEPFDIAVQGWLADYLDPGDFIDYALATPGVAGPGFHDEAFAPRLAAVARLAGPQRYLAYGRLAVALARDSAPWIAFGNATTADFFSARIGCQVAQPTSGIDLAALCLRG